MLFAELLIYIIFAVLYFPVIIILIEFCHAAWIEIQGIGSQRSEPALLSSQFTTPTFPTYRGKFILESRKTDKTKAESAIKAIYNKSGLSNPLIIWTQSPLANVLAKTAIDYFSQKPPKPHWNPRQHGKSAHNNKSLSLIHI